MEVLTVSSRTKRSYGTYFPEPVLKEKDEWGQTMVGTEGYMTKYKLITGNLAAVRARINAVAGQYSSQRKKFPMIDQINLFQNIAQIRPTTLEYWDYAGRIDTVVRNAVSVSLRSGERRDLDRNQGTGFRGIITISDKPWSMEAFMMEELTRTRLSYLAMGLQTKVPDLPLTEPWRLRDAAERQLRSIWEIAWQEWAAEPTPDKLQAVINVEQNVQRYALDSLQWSQFINIWEHMKALPFPDRAGALRLWEQDRIRTEGDNRPLGDSLFWDETEPWYMDMPSAPEVEVTACRKATMSDGKVAITIHNSPILSILEHPQLNTMHQLISYGRHHHNTKKGTGISKTTINPNAQDFKSNPFLGDTKSGSDPWDGSMPDHPGWNALTAGGSIPDPKLKVRDRVVTIPPAVAERIQAAFLANRPVLIEEELNGSVAPILVLPRMFMQTQITPLFSGGTDLRPVLEGSEASGWAVLNTENSKTSGLFDLDTLNGFVTSPISANPSREGAMAEILPG